MSANATAIRELDGELSDYIVFRAFAETVELKANELTFVNFIDKIEENCPDGYKYMGFLQLKCAYPTTQWENAVVSVAEQQTYSLGLTTLCTQVYYVHVICFYIKDVTLT